MIKYSFAKHSGRLVHINSVTNDDRQQNQYTCIECGERMVAHISGSRKKHFHHYTNPQHNFETYLHRVAKEIIYTSYISALSQSQSVMLEYQERLVCTTHNEHKPEPCPWANIVRERDLAQDYKTILLEKRSNGLQPDLCLIADNFPPIFIEILVTHACEPEKINAGFAIIEIRIETEEDLQKLYTLRFALSDKAIRFYNFTPVHMQDSFCTYNEDGCYKSFYYLHITKDGRYDTGINTHAGVIKLSDNNPGSIIYARRCLKGSNYAYEDFKSMFKESEDAGTFLSSCLNCKYHEQYHHEYHSIYCSNFKGITPLHNGQNCVRYKEKKGG